MIDQVSIERIKLLHPKLQQEALQILKEIDALHIHCRFTHTLRTFAEQDLLYAQGRTRPGKKVTNAKGGQSVHNYGLAIDFALGTDKTGDGKLDEIIWDTKVDLNGNKKADWLEVVSIFKKHGWTWGGDWKSFPDAPHVEKTFGLTLKQIQSKYKANNHKNYIPV